MQFFCAIFQIGTHQRVNRENWLYHWWSSGCSFEFKSRVNSCIIFIYFVCMVFSFFYRIVHLSIAKSVHIIATIAHEQFAFTRRFLTSSNTLIRLWIFFFAWILLLLLLVLSYAFLIVGFLIKVPLILPLVTSFLSAAAIPTSPNFRKMFGVFLSQSQNSLYSFL